MSGNGIELGTAYISIVGDTRQLATDVKDALNGSGKDAERAGREMGKTLSAAASKAMRDGWKPDMDIMAGLPDSKSSRIGARIGQVIGKGVVTGLRARQAGAEFGHSFADGAGSIGLGRVIAGWRSELSGGGAMRNLGMLAGKSFSAALTGAVGLGVAAAGMALTKGFQRLLTIDTAKFKLKGLGKSTGEIADIVKTVTHAVTGTPFSLDEAFGTATQAIGANVKDLQGFMQSVSDAAGFAGTSIDRMGLIFTQVLAKGKLTGEEMMQLMEAGLPAKSWITESYQLTSDQFDKMQAKGEITMDMLEKSIGDHAGGMAKKLGDTLQGSIDNMQASIARVGADFLSALFGGPQGDPTEGMKDSVQRVTEQLNRLDGWINAHRDDIRKFFEGARDAAKMVLDVVGDIAGVLKEHPGLIKAVVGAFVAWKAIEGVAALTTALKTIKTLLAVDIPAAAGVGAASASAKFGPLLATLGRLIPLVGFAAVPDTQQIPDDIYQQQLNDLRAANDMPPLPSSSVGGNAAASILGGMAGGSGGNVTGGGLPFGVGGGGRGYMNYGKSAAWLDQVTGRGSQRVLNFDGSITGQKFSWDCAPGSAEIILNGQSVIRSEESLIADMGTTRSGTNFGGGRISGALNRAAPGANYREVQAGGVGVDKFFGDISRSVGSGRGAMLNWNTPAGGPVPQGVKGTQATQYGSGGIGHYVAAMGVDPSDRSIKIADPKDGREYWISAENALALSRSRGYVASYDSGGWLPPGSTMAVNATGKPELVLTHDQAQALQNGDPIKPNSTQHGLAPADYQPGPASDMLKQLSGPVPDPNNPDEKPDYGQDFVRSLGFIPATAGNTGVAGTSSLAGFINMGNSVVSGVIDTGVNLANTAATAAITAGTMGSAAAAGPAASMAASYGIQLAGNEAKRVSQWGFQMLGIGADALMEQMFPFGAPRWLGYDYTQFAPQLGIQQAATSSLEKMGSDAINKAINPQQAASGASAPIGPGTMTAPAAPAPPGAPPAGGPGQASPPPSGPAPEDPLKNIGVFDSGGWLQPGAVGVNLSNRPEPVLTAKHWEAMTAAAGAPSGGATYNVYATDTDDAIRKLRRRENLNAMQYTGRPS